MPESKKKKLEDAEKEVSQSEISVLQREANGTLAE